MYSSKPDSMTISVRVHMWHKKTKTEALLDSGATHNFIDKRAVKALGLGTKDLRQPLRVNDVDGTENQAGRITEFCNLRLKQGDRTSKQGYYVANLGRDRIILGHPWFRSFNPSINWETNQLEGDDVDIETAGYRRKIQTSKPTLNAIDGFPESPSPKSPIIDPSIPPYYHRHWKVFDETASYRFPPARRDDHPINLKPGAPDSLDCKIYRLTDVELQTTQDFIKDELAKVSRTASWTLTIRL